MKRRLSSLVLALLLAAGLLTGCQTVGEIAGNVSEAARAELEKQVRAVLEEYRVDVVELKTAAGKLNGGEGSVQFFCAVLVRAENDTILQSCATTLGKIFRDAGIMSQTGSEIESPYLVNKHLSYSFAGFRDGSSYYTIYVYSTADPQSLLDFEAR